MKNRKLNQLLVAGMISAAMMTSGISVQAADFSDDTSTVEEQSVGSAEEEAPEVEDGSEFQSDAAEASSAVAVSSANFPDAKFRQYVLDNIDTDKDKKLSAAEIKAAKTIDVSGLGISNLKGIERFTYATDLFAANNKLTSVNITKNTKVAYLNLSNNSLAGTLDLSKCTNLRVVKYGSNKLTKVVMPSKKYLKNLDFVDASSNKFTTQANAGLNIGDTDYVKSLSEVNASNNAITSFNCAGFQGILDLRNNKITNLKLENSKEGSQVVSLYLDGNSLSKTPSIDFTPEWILRSWSNSAEVKATATGTKPAISVKSTKKGVATVSWKAVAGADGYDVYCGSSKKSQKGTVVKGTTKLTANKTKLTSGKTYYFRARAYKMVGSAKVYTGYSAVKSVKVK